MIALLIFVFIVSSLTFAAVEDEKIASSTREKEANICFLPPYPEHGRYTVSNYPFAMPGDSYQYVKLDVTCDLGYLNGNATNSILCINGFWSATMPSCVPDSGFCTLKDELSVEYRCVWVLGSLELSEECPYMVPSGTVVRPICRFPAYFSLRALSEMHCKDGIWDYNPICKPACGLITQHRKLEGSSTNHLELPWHAVIYDKRLPDHYYNRCSGSLITASKIISVARCFTNVKGKLLPASNYMVAVNKMYSEYNDSRDVNSQWSDVVDIKIPTNYRYIIKSNENDIAIVIVERPFIFHLSVRPVCLDFDNDLDRTQLTEGNSGKVARWRFDNNYSQSFILNVNELHYKKCEDVYDMYWRQYRRVTTEDKFCSRYSSYNRYEQLDNIHGAGIAFLESTTQRYYLRGVGSVIILSNHNTQLYMFTSIKKYEHFIKQYL